MRRVWGIFSVFLIVSLGFAGAPYIESRERVDLNGRWQIIVDPYDNGYYDYQLRPHTQEGYFANRLPRDPSDRVEYRFSDAHTLQVPGDWNTQDERLFYYEGTIWYKKDFDRPFPEGRIFLYFGAVNYACDVYLNGRKIGSHVGGFTPFAFEITKEIRDRDNFLILWVNNTRLREGVPTVNTDWWNYGGITRPIYLVRMPEVFIADFSVYLDRGSTNRISGWVRLDGPKKKERVVLTIPELRIRRVLTTDSLGRASFTLTARPRLWSPEDPKRYRVVFATETDQVEDWIGFRTIDVTGEEIRLNGRPLFLRGICLHEEAPFRGGRLSRPEEARILLGWAKELECNFVRLAHYPHSEDMVRMADAMGLLVWSEIPVYWTIDFENPETYANAENQLVENITRDKNRACVTLWSIANETPVHPARNRFLAALAQKARALDPTRLITAASDKSSTDGYTYTISDPLCDVLDVIGVNEYIGWYDGLPEKCDRVTWNRAYPKPVIVSEFGGDALYGLHGDARTRWSEEYQEDLYRRQIAMLERIPFLRGVSPWILMDFRSPRRPLYGIQDGWNRKGLISNAGDKKKAFFILQEWYRSMSEGWVARP